MSIFTSLNPLSMISNAVESAFDAVLPKQLEFLGDAAALVTDLETGNYLKCLDDALDLFKDLPQQLGELTKNCGGPAGAGDSVDLLSGVSGLLEPNPPAPYPAAGPPDEGASTGIQDPMRTTPFGRATEAKPMLQNAPMPPLAGLAPSVTAGRATQPTAAPVVKGKVHAHKASKSHKTATVAKPDEVAKPDKTAEAAEVAPEVSSTETSKTKEPAGTKSRPAQASRAMSPDTFFKLSDKALMDAVRDGKIPDSVKSDPEQMRRLQVRMEDIAQMNSIITSMLNTMHEMNKAIIQNLRV